MTLWSCSKQEDTQEAHTSLLRYPSYFGKPNLNSEKNPISESGIALGKKLFFDPILSGNNAISCATCHVPKLAFSDGIAQSTLGQNRELIIRNSPPIMNLAWHDNYFWDGGATDLESQALGPLTSLKEMGQDIRILADELNSQPEYPELFQNVFNDKITINYIIRALAQYQRSLISSNSKYDSYIRGTQNLTTEELHGLDVFTQNCSSCHKLGHFSDFEFHNNGLDSAFDFVSNEDERWGRYRITVDTKDIGKYKTPSLRNIEITYPYMHDGRFETLEEVLEHYSKNIRDYATLDATIPHSGFHFSEKEKTNVIQFLKTLTDPSFIK